MIKTVALTKKYDEAYAIQDINLDLQAGDLFGFIGPNGAGKTTTMKILATLLQPSSGEAYVGDHSIYREPKEIRRMVGYMPDFFGVYDDMKVIEYLEFFAAAYRISGSRRRQVCNEKLELVDLDFKRDAFASTLSRGQTQRLGLARVLLHEPQVLLLDEPLSGLDPRARIEMRAVLRRLGEQGKTIMVSSHILPELADMCNKVGIIDRGVMGFSGTVEEAIQKVRPRIVLQIEIVGDLPTAANLLRKQPLVAEVAEHPGTGLMPGVPGTPGKEPPRLVVTLHEGVKEYAELSSLLITAGYPIKLFREEEVNLESAFMLLTKGLGVRT